MEDGQRGAQVMGEGDHSSAGWSMESGTSSILRVIFIRVLLSA